MLLEDVSRAVAGVPHISPARGRELYDFILRERPREVLELGFAHGASTCYLAAALQELGGGTVTTLDNRLARNRKPSLPELLARTGLSDHVRPVFAQRTYTWELKRLLEHGAAFEFAFVDGAHTWEVDGLAFFLVDRLLRAGSWVCFDDLDWTIASSPTLRDDPAMRALPEEERNTQQVRAVFELLVRQHPGYGDFREDRDWGWARKQPLAPSPLESDAEHRRSAKALEAELRAVRSSVSWRVGRAVTWAPRAARSRLRGRR